jgi:hypothetical protein
MTPPTQARPFSRSIANVAFVLIGFGFESALQGLGAPPWSFAPVWLMFVALRHQGNAALALTVFGAYVYDVVSGETRGLIFGAATYTSGLMAVVWTRRGEATPTVVIIGSGLLTLMLGAIRVGLARLAGLPEGGFAGWLAVAPLSMGLAWPIFRAMDVIDAWFRGRETGFRFVEGP